MSIYLDEFETLYGTSDNIKKLRNKILELAFQGKLTSYKESDTNLDSYLDKLDRQRESKIQEIKHYKKRNIQNIKNESQKKSKNWSFTRLSRVANIVTGSKNANYADDHGKYHFFTCAKKPKRSKDYSFEGESILLPGNGANVGYVTYYNGKFEAYQRTYVVQPYGDINSKYLYYHFKYNWEKYNLNKQYGSATNYIKMKNLTNYIIDITSPEEQKRIVNKIEKLMKEADKLESKLEKKEKISQKLSESIVDAIKDSQNVEEIKEKIKFIIENFDVIFKTSKSMDEMRNIVLQLAIEGKLVPQDESDMPSFKLIKKIKKEKEKLIKEGKIKKNHVNKIKGNEIPFAIPNNWKWVRLNQITEVNPRNSVNDEKEVSFVPMTLIEDGYGSYFDFEIKNWKEIKKGYTHFAENDIGVAKITPCFQNRKSLIFKGLKSGFGAGTTELHIIRVFSNNINRKYYCIYLKLSGLLRKEYLTFQVLLVNKELILLL